MNRGQIRTLASLFASDPNQTRYSGLYNDAIDRAQEQFAIDSKALFKDTSFSIVSGTATYSLPTDFMYEKKVTFNGKGLLPITRADLEFYKRSDDWTDDEGTPTHYIVDPEEARKQLRVYPKPQGADEGTNNLTLTYYPLPAAITDDSTKPFNDSSLMIQFHMAVAAYAAWILLGYDPATEEILAKRASLLAQYSDKVTEAQDTYGNTKSAPLRLKGGRVWR